MANNNQNSAITWRQISVIIALLGLFFVGGGFLYTKADKQEVAKAEERCTEKIDKLEMRVGDDISEIKEKIDDVYKLLLEMKD